jgi:hypothetical protein
LASVIFICEPCYEATPEYLGVRGHNLSTFAPGCSATVRNI